MIFRLYHETRGGHVHCRRFAGKHDGALGKCGNLTMKVDEFEAFVRRFAFIELRHERTPGEKLLADGLPSNAGEGET